jgi:hypothetical protein
MLMLTLPLDSRLAPRRKATMVPCAAHRRGATLPETHGETPTATARGKASVAGIHYPRKARRVPWVNQVAKVVGEGPGASPCRGRPATLARDVADRINWDADSATLQLQIIPGLWDVFFGQREPGITRKSVARFNQPLNPEGPHGRLRRP